MHKYSFYYFPLDPFVLKDLEKTLKNYKNPEDSCVKIENNKYSVFLPCLIKDTPAATEKNRCLFCPAFIYTTTEPYNIILPFRL